MLKWQKRVDLACQGGSDDGHISRPQLYGRSCLPILDHHVVNLSAPIRN